MNNRRCIIKQGDKVPHAVRCGEVTQGDQHPFPQVAVNLFLFGSGEQPAGQPVVRQFVQCASGFGATAATNSFVSFKLFNRTEWLCGSFAELIYCAVGEAFARKSVRPIQRHHFIRPEDPRWRSAKL